MASYPVSVPLPHKHLKNLSLDIALEQKRKLEDYLNEQAKTRPAVVLTYAQIAGATGISEKIVEAFLFPLDGGHRGITINNPQLETGRQV